MQTTAQPDTAHRDGTDSTTTDSAPRTWPRRAVLTGSGAALLACAACGSSNSTPPATSGAAAADPPPAGTSSAAAGSAGKTALASVSDIPSDSGLIVTAPSGQVILAKADGKVVAHTAVCTHQGAIIDGGGVCPLHGSRFNVSTGAVIQGPADEPLAAVAVTETDGKVFPA